MKKNNITHKNFLYNLFCTNFLRIIMSMALTLEETKIFKELKKRNVSNDVLGNLTKISKKM